MPSKTDHQIERAITVYGRQGGASTSLWQRLKPWHRRLVVLVVLGMVGLAGAFVMWKAYGLFREHQLDRNLEEAQVAARIGDWPLARNRARSVLLARPGDFEAFRVWQRALGEMNEPRSYMAAAQLFMDPRATLEDRLQSLRFMCLQAPQAVALGAFAALDEETQNLPDARAALVEVLLLRQEYQFAEGFLRELGDLDNHPQARLALIKVLCATPTADRIAEARELFAALVREDAVEEALTALETLGDVPGGLAPGVPLPDLPVWVQRHLEKAKDLHHLLALHPELETHAENEAARDRIFNAAATRFSSNAPGTLATWLIRHDRAGQAATLLENSALIESSAFIARLQALVRLKRFDEVTSLLSTPPQGIDAVEKELVQVAVARLQGDSGVEIAAWNRALYQALLDDSKNRFIEIAKHAEMLDSPTVAERAWVAAVRVGWGRLPLYRDFLPLFSSLARNNRTHDLEAMYLGLVRYEPGNPELLNNVIYLGLLHGKIRPELAMAQLARLAADNPTMPELYSGAAVAALLSGEGDQALEWLPLFAETRRVTPTMRIAITGIAHLVEGRTEEGTRILETVQWQHLLNQENVVFRKLLLNLKVQNLPVPELIESVATENVEETAAWDEAMKRLERDRVGDILPPLPPPCIRSDERDDDGQD